MYTNLYITYIYLFVYFKSDYFSLIFISVPFCMDKSLSCIVNIYIYYYEHLIVMTMEF